MSREIVAFHAEWLRSVDRPIYLDGRPHPSELAPHTWAGFSTGRWEGTMLTITTTHLKEGYLRRNGLPRSDKATIVEHWIRAGDFLTAAVIMHDPVYLTEPFMRTSDYEFLPTQNIPPYPCGVVEEVDRPRGVVPHWLPGANPFLLSFAQKWGIPRRRGRGGRRDDVSRISREIEDTPAAPTGRARRGPRSLSRATVGRGFTPRHGGP